jgi:hypothetical protein
MVIVMTEKMLYSKSSVLSCRKVATYPGIGAVRKSVDKTAGEGIGNQGRPHNLQLANLRKILSHTERMSKNFQLMKVYESR